VKIQNLKTTDGHEASSNHAKSALANFLEPDPQAISVGNSQACERQEAEVALLRARIQHLELVVETARGLLGSNQDRLLRRLYEVPRELVTLSQRLQRLDPQATW
jgi:hypothetical protein